jgi:hypothetical protein
VQLLEQDLELLGRHLRPHSLISVYELSVGSTTRSTSRLLADPDEVVQDRLRRQLLDDARAGPAAASPVATTGTSSRFSARRR